METDDKPTYNRNDKEEDGGHFHTFSGKNKENKINKDENTLQEEDKMDGRGRRGVRPMKPKKHYNYDEDGHLSFQSPNHNEDVGRSDA